MHLVIPFGWLHGAAVVLMVVFFISRVMALMVAANPVMRMMSAAGKVKLPSPFWAAFLALPAFLALVALFLLDVNKLPKALEILVRWR